MSGKERGWSFAPQAPEGGWGWPKGAPTRQRGRRRGTEPGKEQAGDLPRWKEASTARSIGRNSRGAQTPLKKAEPDRQGVREAKKSAFPVKAPAQAVIRDRVAAWGVKRRYRAGGREKQKGGLTRGGADPERESK